MLSDNDPDKIKEKLKCDYKLISLRKSLIKKIKREFDEINLNLPFLSLIEEYERLLENDKDSK